MKKYFDTTWRLWDLLKPFHTGFYFQLLFIIVSQLLNVLSVVVLAYSINNIVDKQFEYAAYLVVVYFLVNFLKTIVNYLKDSQSNIKLSFRIQQFLQGYSFEKIFKLNASQQIEDHSAIKLQTIARGEEAVQQIVSTIFLNLLPTATQVIFSLIAIAWYSWPVALVTLFTFILTILWTNRFTNFHRPFLRKNIENWDQQRKIRTESFQHLSLIKTSGIENEYIKLYLSNRENVIDYSINMRQMSISHATKRWNFNAFGNMISRLLLVYYAFLEKLLIGDIYAIWSWMSEANNNIFTVVNAMRDIPNHFVELEKYLNIIDKNLSLTRKGKRSLTTETLFSKT
jgi:ABC-type multidrug transport system fused ATPase/permease subunit